MEIAEMKSNQVGQGANTLISARRQNYRQYAILVLRVVVGVFFVIHGLEKIGILGEGGFGDAVGFFAQNDMPAPHITAPILAFVEAAGGLALIFGIGSRAFAILLAAIVAGEILVVKLPGSLNPFGEPGYLFELTLLISLVALSFVGPGAHALGDESA
jgi:putative oxidoreductase